MILECCRIIVSLTPVASAKLHTLSMNLEHAEPKATYVLTELEGGTRFPFKIGDNY